VLHRSNRWPASVRPVDRANQAGGYNSRTKISSKKLSDSSRPWNKTTSKTQPAREETPTQNLARHHTTCQELTNITRAKTTRTTQLIKGKSHKASALITPVMGTGQTGPIGQLRMNSNPRVNSPKSNSKSPESFHGFAQDIGDSRNTSWALHSQDLVHQNFLNREKSKKSH
jgi:hypothetical protein